MTWWSLGLPLVEVVAGNPGWDTGGYTPVLVVNNGGLSEVLHTAQDVEAGMELMKLLL